jgi:hypothetical protein
VPEQIELRKISSNDYSGATVTEWGNSTCQHSSVRSDTVSGCHVQTTKIVAVWKELICSFEKMASDNDDRQKEDQAPGEEIDTTTRLVVRM